MSPQHKICRVCKVEKQISEFYKHNGRKDGYRSECKPCHIQSNTDWNKANRDKKSMYNKTWKATEKGKESTRRYKRKRRQVHRNATPLWASKKSIDEAYEIAKETGLIVDHIVPLVSDRVCGLHCPDNFRCITDKLNRFKSNRYWPDMAYTVREA